MNKINKELEQTKRFISSSYNRNVDSDNPLFAIYIDDDRFITQYYRRKQRKPYEYFCHSTKKDMDEYVEKCIEREERIAKAKIKEKVEKKAKNDNFIKSLKVGDIFHASWGYEQTNVNFYQIVSLKKSTAEFREIGYETVPGSEGYDCCDVTATKDAFLKDSEIFKKRISSDWVKIDEVRSAKKIDNENQKFYKSWYY